MNRVTGAFAGVQAHVVAAGRRPGERRAGAAVEESAAHLLPKISVLFFYRHKMAFVYLNEKSLPLCIL